MGQTDEFAASLLIVRQVANQLNSKQLNPPVRVRQATILDAR